MQWLANVFFNWFWDKTAKFLTDLYQRLARRDQIKKDEQASVEPLKNATTPEEIDSATDSALNGL